MLTAMRLASSPVIDYSLPVMNWIHSTHPLLRFAEVVGYVLILSLVFGFLGFRDSAFFLAVGVLLSLKALKWVRSRTAEKSD